MLCPCGDNQVRELYAVGLLLSLLLLLLLLLLFLLLQLQFAFVASFLQFMFFAANVNVAGVAICPCRR